LFDIFLMTIFRQSCLAGVPLEGISALSINQ
jgi:hypothetical protein